ncbi:MAG TPA: glycoside hydrolase family 9 protein [Pyrinomonadaceae bacterium]
MRTTTRVVVLTFVLLLIAKFPQNAQQTSLLLNDLEYFELPGLNVMAFQDIYPEGHQAGVSIIQNGVRVATNGDLRLDPTPGQWQPMPKQDKRTVSKERNEITTWLSYPDPSRNRTGFNPIDYPDLNLSYQVIVKGEGKNIHIVVDLDKALPENFVGRVGFNLELYPGNLFGKSWYLDEKSGIFPRQPNGPDVKDASGEIQPLPLATGKRLSVAPEVDAQRIVIESNKSELQLLDGRNKHNNGWFIVRSLVPANTASHAIDWIITAHAIPGWKYQPVVHVSQIGYHPKQKKLAIIELDSSDHANETFRLMRVSETGGFEPAAAGTPTFWGKFLRYRYLQFDFSKVERPGVYVAEYRNFRSQPFQISSTIYQRGVWQPVLEYFLPVQMCHMRVEEQYRVWHGACHLDDARMADTNYNHFDGYVQGPGTLSRARSGETVPGLNVGGWHDAGDDDLRIESQADEVSILGSAYEAFALNYDDTTIDQRKRLTKIHQPDGKPDALQQIEHGVLTILGGYNNLGRLYRGIIVPTLPQYVLLGEETNSTDNLFYDSKLSADARTATHSGQKDDRLVFTEENPGHEYKGIAALAIAGRVLQKFNPQLAKQCVAAAEELWKQNREASKGFDEHVSAAVELWLTTNKSEYGEFLLTNRKEIVSRADRIAWSVGKVLPLIKDKSFIEAMRTAVTTNFAKTVQLQKETPFGVPYRPHIWGAGWDLQEFGVHQYYLHRAFPDIVSTEYMLNALNFVLGVHPGENTASFASGVGSRSMTTAYGINRADWSYIPGGVASGTALIRPDFPELKDFPFLWQQAEYVLGGGSSNYMFLVLAADQVLNGKR